MKIAYVINSLEGGGAALPVPAVTGMLRETGAEVRLFALSRRDVARIGPVATAENVWTGRTRRWPAKPLSVRLPAHGSALFLLRR